LLRDADLPKIRSHDLKYTSSSLMLNHIIPLIVVSRRLDHAKPSITLDIYGHLITGMQVEAEEMIELFIFPVWIGKLNTFGVRRIIP
jgi:integrase